MLDTIDSLDAVGMFIVVFRLLRECRYPGVIKFGSANSTSSSKDLLRSVSFLDNFLFGCVFVPSRSRSWFGASKVFDAASKLPRSSLSISVEILISSSSLLPEWLDSCSVSSMTDLSFYEKLNIFWPSGVRGLLTRLLLLFDL